jgi:hypothetical protein
MERISLHRTTKYPKHPSHHFQPEEKQQESNISCETKTFASKTIRNLGRHKSYNMSGKFQIKTKKCILEQSESYVELFRNFSCKLCMSIRSLLTIFTPLRPYHAFKPVYSHHCITQTYQEQHGILDLSYLCSLLYLLKLYSMTTLGESVREDCALQFHVTFRICQESKLFWTFGSGLDIFGSGLNIHHHQGSIWRPLLSMTCRSLQQCSRLSWNWLSAMARQSHHNAPNSIEAGFGVEALTLDWKLTT